MVVAKLHYSRSLTVGIYLWNEAVHKFNNFYWILVRGKEHCTLLGAGNTMLVKIAMLSALMVLIV